MNYQFLYFLVKKLCYYSDIVRKELYSERYRKLTLKIQECFMIERMWYLKLVLLEIAAFRIEWSIKGQFDGCTFLACYVAVLNALSF